MVYQFFIDGIFFRIHKQYGVLFLGFYLEKYKHTYIMIHKKSYNIQYFASFLYTHSYYMDNKLVSLILYKHNFIYNVTHIII